MERLYLITILLAGAMILRATYVSRNSGNVRKIKAARFRSQPIMNKSEQRVFSVINRWISERDRDLTLSVQVPYGAFLTSKSPLAWRYVAAKRADFVLWDGSGHVCGIVEYDGPGHLGRDHSDAVAVKNRDMQKNEAAASAGIPILRLTTLSEPSIRNALEQLLAPTTRA